MEILLTNFDLSKAFTDVAFEEVGLEMFNSQSVPTAAILSAELVVYYDMQINKVKVMKDRYATQKVTNLTYEQYHDYLKIRKLIF